MSDDRCYGCSQENCGRTRCFCSCHGPTPRQTNCPKGIHEAVMSRCGGGRPTEYWCLHCYTPTDVTGMSLPKGMLLPPMKCERHPKYQGKRRPRAICETCHYIWEKNQR